MRKMSLTLVLVLLFATITQAQTVEFGLKGGVNFANLNYESNIESNSRTSLHAGLLSHFHLNKNWAIQPELVFSGQGAKYDGGRIDKLGYLNIPVLVMYMFDNGFRLHTGPQLGFLLNAESKIGGQDVDIKDDLNSTDFSWAFGIGYITPSGFGFDARYNLGLSNISDSDNSVKNNVFQLGLLYQFRKVHTKHL